MVTKLRAQLLHRPKTALVLSDIPKPKPLDNQLLIKISACGVCRTDLHIFDGELTAPHLPLILGHQIVGYVEGGPKAGQRVGVAWLQESCGGCFYCQNGQENLCDLALFTGFDCPGGFAEYCIAPSDFVFPLNINLTDAATAPLLCAGMIGYRALRFLEGAKKVGFYGFGTSAHILCQLVNQQGGQVFAFTRPGNKESQAFAKKWGAYWVGDATQLPPEPLDGAIIFASVGSLIPQALKAVRKGGTVVCAAIHMSDIPAFPYALLWEERKIISVANLTRTDGEEFLAQATNLKTETTLFSLEEANEALEALRKGAHGCVLSLLS